MSAAVLSGCGGGGASPPSDTELSDGSNLGATISGEAVGACSSELADALSEAPASGVVGLADRGDGCDYSVTGLVRTSRSVEIASGVTIVLEAGASIVFGGENSSLLGLADAPIRFQARDAASSWDSIRFTRSGSQLDHVLFSGGGAGSLADDDAAMVELNASLLSLTDSVFVGSASAGLELSLSSAAVTGMERFSRNRFSGNAGAPVIVDSNVVGGLDGESSYQSSESPNGIDAIRVAGPRLSGRLPALQIAYRIDPPTLVRNSAEVTFTNAIIAAGVTVELPPVTRIVFEDSSAEGSVDDPVTFRPAGTSAWSGLVVSGESTLRHAVLINAGSPNGDVGSALLLPYTADLDISNVSIDGSAGFGLGCEAPRFGAIEAPIQVTAVEFDGTTLGTIDPGCQIVNVAADTIDGAAVPARREVDGCATVLGRGDELPAVLSNTDAACDYYVVGDVGTRVRTGDIAIEAGTSLVFARDASLSVNGSLRAIGSVDEPISFMGEVVEEGSWDGLRLQGSVALQGVRISEAGGGNGPAVLISEPFRTDLSNAVALSDVTVEGSDADGLELRGLRLSIVRFENNAFIGNRGFGLALPIAFAERLDEGSLYDSTMAPNGRRGIRLNDQLRGVSVSLSPALNVPWYLPGLRVSDGSSRDGVQPIGRLTILPGTELIVARDGVLGVDENVVLQGSAAQPIRISGPDEEPTAWGGLLIRNIDAAHLDIVGGGSVAATNSAEPGALVVTGQGSVRLSTVSIRDSQGWALSCSSNTIPENFALDGLSYQSNASGNVNPVCGE